MPDSTRPPVASEGVLAGGEVLLIGFCAKAREDGQAAAVLSATAHIVAAAAYIEEVAGPIRARRILVAAIETIDRGKPGVN